MEKSHRVKVQISLTESEAQQGSRSAETATEIPLTYRTL